MIGKHVHDDIGSDDADFMRRVAFAVVPKTAHIQGNAVNIKHGDGGDPPNRNVIGFLVFMLDADRIVGSDTRAPTHRAQSEDSLHVIFGDVLTLVVPDEVLARGDYPRPFRDREDGRTLRRKGLRHSLIQSLDDRDYGDHGGDANNDAHQGQRSAQFVLAQAAGRDAKRFP